MISHSLCAFCKILLFTCARGADSRFRSKHRAVTTSAKAPDKGFTDDTHLPLFQLVRSGFKDWGSVQLEEGSAFDFDFAEQTLAGPDPPSAPLFSLVRNDFETWGLKAANHNQGHAFAMALDTAVADVGQAHSLASLGRLRFRAFVVRLRSFFRTLDLQEPRSVHVLNLVAILALIMLRYALPQVPAPRLRLQSGKKQDGRSNGAQRIAESKAAPPVTKTEKMTWRIHDCTESQSLKVGLRQLKNRLWALTDESGFPRKVMFLREALMQELCEGQVGLDQVHAGDLAAAQGDVCKLTLSQLLDLSLKFEETGNWSQDNFMRIVDNVLFERLGRIAIKGIKLGKAVGIEDMRRLGREAVMFVAAASWIPVSPVWVWWVQEQRVFFNTSLFACVDEFPAGGAMEVASPSRSERCHGGVLDWEVDFVTYIRHVQRCVIAHHESTKRKPRNI